MRSAVGRPIRVALLRHMLGYAFVFASNERKRRHHFVVRVDNLLSSGWANDVWEAHDERLSAIIGVPYDTAVGKRVDGNSGGVALPLAGNALDILLRETRQAVSKDVVESLRHNLLYEGYD